MCSSANRVADVFVGAPAEGGGEEGESGGRGKGEVVEVDCAAVVGEEGADVVVGWRGDVGEAERLD